jgi:tetratricopeptide (TPR) repeat protein
MAHLIPRFIVSAALTFLAAAMIHPVSPQQNEERVAVVIGNAAYPDIEGALKDPINNARSLAEGLRRQGFEVDSGEDLTKEADHTEALNNCCWARAVMGELQPALKDCNTALALRSRYVDALDSRRFVNLKRGQPNDAIVDYHAALRINPKQASSLYGRGTAKLRVGNAGGNIAAAKLIQSNIADEFERYGIR